jgi:c(7)-type cytochrome triheme protein
MEVVMRVRRFVFLLSLAVTVLFSTALIAVSVGQAAGKPPEKIVFVAKTGSITFLHAKHAERLRGDCKESAKAPLGYKAGLHKPAEKAKTSCAACHVAKGTAFPSVGNCKKCHVK